MKRLKVKVLAVSFPLLSHTIGRTRDLEKEVNDFLVTIDADKIYQINYLNSSASSSSIIVAPRIFVSAIITYWGDQSDDEVE